MNILFAASEVAPFIKTGGLADVAGSLPQALAACGHDVRVILPLYEGIGQEWRSQMTYLFNFHVRLAWRSPYCGIFELKRDNVTYYFVDNEYYFKRSSIYGHYDDGERFAFFSRAVIETPGHLNWHPEVLHCNDWQTALVPIYLLEERHRVPQLYNTKSVYTIHNIEYQGRYGKQTLEDLFGLNAGYFNEHMLRYHGDVNLMKGAIYAADYVTTVSPTYAEELQYPFYAHGLEGVISDNRHKLRGILNGIDTSLYDPAHDQGLAQNFSADDLSGKAACKTALQRAVGLREDPNVPIIACISRLVKHKGFELVTSAIHDIMATNAQMVVLGTGDWNFEEAFRQAQAQYPGRFSANIMYSGSLSTAIYGGADLFLMPSISEPCGLSQIIAMRYGTLPVVRETGGLRDTVRPCGVDNATGFTFADINAHDMVWVIREAVNLYHNDKYTWNALQRAGMTADFSWRSSAEEYLQVYNWITGLDMHPYGMGLGPFEDAAPVEETPAVESADAVEQPVASVPEEVKEEPAPVEEKPAPAKKTTTRKTAAKKSTTRKTKAKTDAPAEEPKAEPAAPVEEVKAEPAAPVEEVKAEPAAPVEEVKAEPAAPVEEVKADPAAPVEEVKAEPAAPVEEVKAEPAAPAAEKPAPAKKTTTRKTTTRKTSTRRKK